MCGIFGWDINPRMVSHNQLAILGSWLASKMDYRGGDSWGYVIPGKTPVKGLGKMIGHTLNLSRSYRVLAHTRKGTTGAITVENAHPFQIGKYIGVHNGVISDHKELNTKHKRTCEVDSMHIYHHLNEGIDISELQGYGALGFLHLDYPDRIYLADIGNGSMHVFGLGDKGDAGFIFASTESAVKDSLEAAGFSKGQYTEYDVKEGRTYYLEGGKYYYLTEGKEMKLKSWSSARTSYQPYSGHESDYYQGYNGVYGGYYRHGKHGNGGDSHMGGDVGATRITRTSRPDLVSLDGGKNWRKTSTNSSSESPDSKGQDESKRRNRKAKNDVAYDSYVNAMFEFFDRVCIDMDCGIVPTDMPTYKDWQSMSDTAKAVLVRDDCSSVLDKSYPTWLRSFHFPRNNGAQKSFNAWLNAGMFEVRPQQKTVMSSVVSVVNKVTDAVSNLVAASKPSQNVLALGPGEHKTEDKKPEA
jgi:hypothetical protein